MPCADESAFAVTPEIEPENVLTGMTSTDHSKIMKMVA